MNKTYGYCKAIAKETGKEVRGYFALLPYTTYCVTEDYEAHPENDKAYVISTQMTDWGLPNKVKMVEVEFDSVKRYIGKDKDGYEVFEEDHIVISFDGFDVTRAMYMSDWENSVSRREDKKWALTKVMGRGEDKVYLDECELVRG